MHPQPTSGPPTLADKLLTQAHGSPPAEAAVMILIGTVQGRLLDAVILSRHNDTAVSVDWPATRTSAGYLSGGERRLLALADALATGHPIDLADSISGLDTGNAQVVVDAVAHATGAQPWGYDR